MKKIGVLLILLILIMPISFAKQIDIEGVTESEVVEQAAPLTTSSSANDRIYVYGNGLIASVEGEEVEYHHQDIVSSNVAITDYSGDLIESADYLPFGYMFNSVGENEYGFSNKELDDTGLNYFVARYYDSGVGKFISTDPIREGHAYAYVDNNPKKFIDPSGMSFTSAAAESTDPGIAFLDPVRRGGWQENEYGDYDFVERPYYGSLDEDIFGQVGDYYIQNEVIGPVRDKVKWTMVSEAGIEEAQWYLDPVTLSITFLVAPALMGKGPLATLGRLARREGMAWYTGIKNYRAFGVSTNAHIRTVEDTTFRLTGAFIKHGDSSVVLGKNNPIIRIALGSKDPNSLLFKVGVRAHRGMIHHSGDLTKKYLLEEVMADQAHRALAPDKFWSPAKLRTPLAQALKSSPRLGTFSNVPSAEVIEPLWQSALKITDQYLTFGGF